MDRTCISCGKPLITVLPAVQDTRFGIEKVYMVARCGSCGLEQTEPRPNQSELNQLYENFYNFGGEKNTRYMKVREKFVRSNLYRIWLTLDGDISFNCKTGKGALLDVGCNEGRGLDFFRRHGYAAEGLELNPVAADVARRKGFAVYGSTLEEFHSDRKYDVIVLSNVLEHSLNPRNMLGHINKLLNAGGQVWISCPNSRSWLRSLFGRYWINWHVPFHIVHFSPKTLTAMLAKSDFEVASLRQETPALWVAHSLIALLFAKPGQATRQLRAAPLIASLILLIRGLFFPLLWLGNLTGRGDCLVLVARKN